MKRQRTPEVCQHDYLSVSLFSLTNHSDGGEPEVDQARREAMRRVMAEVPDMNKSMLARAWNRDLPRVW